MALQALSDDLGEFEEEYDNRIVEEADIGEYRADVIAMAGWAERANDLL